MTARQTVWFIAGYVALVAAAIWFDLAVLCRGHAKFNGGCGILFVTEVGFLFIKKFPVLLAVETMAIILAFVVRWKTLPRDSGALPSPDTS